jgi:hypothetical protein
MQMMMMMMMALSDSPNESGLRETLLLKVVGMIVFTFFLP